VNGFSARHLRGCFFVVGAAVLVSCGARSGLLSLAAEVDAQGGAGGADAADAPLPKQDAPVDVVLDDVPDAFADRVTDVEPDAAQDAQPDAALTCETALEPVLAGTQSFGGAQRDEAIDVAIGPMGSLIVAGYFMDSADFDPGPGIEKHDAAGYTDVFVTRFDCEGNHSWTRTWGGSEQPASGWGDEPTDIDVADDGAVYVAGQYCSTTDFDPGTPVDLHTSAGCFDAFVSKLSADGDRLWTRTWGGTLRDRASSVSSFSDGVYIGGHFEGSVDLDPTAGSDIRVAVGEMDAYVTKLDAAGGFGWVRTFGGPQMEYAPVSALALPSGGVVVAGNFEDEIDVDPGASVDRRLSQGSDDVFLIALRADGSLAWARTFGGANTELAMSIALSDEIYVGGFFYGPADFDPGPDVDSHEPLGQYSAFVSRFSLDGTHRWTRTWGGSSAGAGVALLRRVAAAPAGGVVAGGSFQGDVDMDPNAGSWPVQSAGNDYDGFALILRFDGATEYARFFGGNAADEVYGLASGPRDTVTAVGSFVGTVDYGDGSHTSAGEYDAFVSVFTP
jgi:hypothetical protein